MNEQRAKEILGRAVTSNGGLQGYDMDHVCYINGGVCVDLDGDFTAEYLEAVVWWMRNVGGGGE